jgi:hypothetical protein
VVGARTGVRRSSGCTSQGSSAISGHLTAGLQVVLDVLRHGERHVRVPEPVAERRAADFGVRPTVPQLCRTSCKSISGQMASAARASVASARGLFAFQRPRLPGGQRPDREEAERSGWRGYFRILTARAITRPRIIRELTACTVIANFPQRASGITSVGLNAVALVKPR